MKRQSLVGELLNFRGIVYAPVNENGVILLFGKVASDLDLRIEEIRRGFPDCIARRYNGRSWERLRIEFEYRSSNFIRHKHDIDDCDIIICWIHDWVKCPLEVIDLKSTVFDIENSIQKLDSPKKQDIETEYALNALFVNSNSILKVKEWYSKLYDKISEIDDTVWVKISTKYISWYSPRNVFASLRIRPTCIQIESFSRGTEISGTSILKLKPLWSFFTIKCDKDVDKAVDIISESLERIKQAILDGESTSYISKKYR